MSLFSFNRRQEVPKNKQIHDLELAKIVPNRYQPRKRFSDESIRELAETLKKDGLLQPIVVRENEQGYELIAGERRYRAAQSLGWTTIPAIINNLTDDESASLALIENLQRENLNPIDEAQAYSNLMELNHLTQTELAKEIGKSQSYVANKLRLLKLEPDVQSYLASGKLSARHGRALVNLPAEDQIKALHEILAEDLTVKETENMAADLPAYFEAKEQAKAAQKAAQEAAEKEAEKAAKAKEKPRIVKRLPKDLQVQVNTIKHAVKLARESGIKVVVHEDKDPDDYKIMIELKRK